MDCATFPMHPKMDEQLARTFVINEEEEERHIQKVQNAFLYYGPYACQRLKRSMDYLNSLSGEDQVMLTKYRGHLQCVRTCIDRNQAVIREILRGRVLYPTDEATGDPSEFDEPPPNVRHGDMDQIDIPFDEADVEPLKILKAQSTLKLIARDWSTEGALEREQSYKPIIDSIVAYFKHSDIELKEIKILVPGAGLGRLTYELACLGYSCEGNEFSYFMLIASNFVLNLCDYENKYVLYPWVHQYVNNLRREDQVAAVRFPDVCPLKNPPKGHFEIAAGDFLEVYKTPNAYNCVATCFFIDCANNVIDFIRTIYKILVPGGIWVNLGPLLYHFSDVSGQNSIEPAFEDLCIIMESVGFVIEKSRTGIRTKYAQNPSSMKQSEYQSLFWVCRKPDLFEEQRGKRKASREPHDLIVREDSEAEEEGEQQPERNETEEKQQLKPLATANCETEIKAQPS
ncbi:carnosine N-methyltransferase isoform X1 [Drosophila mauritiana]|uniref:carnosine N-methyltransferase n=1 Tax=Drosophila mauritiana TaxID=7226 RepID=A0A6P8KY37_DROMA|nr:carnosine N-methyltransferase isoform X1 [Drosophila mauritiana]